MMPPRMDNTYSAARQRFLDAARGADARIDSFPHPMKGREGEDLAIDIAQVGDPDARSVFMIVSGTDGGAGYVGSTLQSWWLDERARALTTGAPRVVLLHGFNPFGFSWVRRVNEDSVDLNRNFVDWTHPPSNAEYADIADLLVPTEWTEETQATTTGALLAFAGSVGLERFQQIVSGGQYEHPTGVFYGGSGPVWSHRWLVEQLPLFVASTERLGIIDIQTGLPESGNGEVVSRDSADDPGYKRGVDWWHDVRSAMEPKSITSQLSGEWLSAVEAIVPGVEVTAAAFEYGVGDVLTLLQAHRADAWLHAHGDPTGPEGAAIRQQVRDALTGGPEWLAEVAQRFDEVSGAAVSALSI